MGSARREELSRWAHALERADGDDLRAAGRAIRTLCETPETLGSSERNELERWAKALGRSETAELRAAGRAIRALCVESPALEDEPASPAPEKRAPVRPKPRTPRKPIAVPWRALGIGLAALALLGVAAVAAARAAAPDLGATGPPTNAVVGRSALGTLTFSARDAHAAWTLDGRAVKPKREGQPVRPRPAKARRRGARGCREPKRPHVLQQDAQIPLRRRHRRATAAPRSSGDGAAGRAARRSRPAGAGRAPRSRREGDPRRRQRPVRAPVPAGSASPPRGRHRCRRQLEPVAGAGHDRAPATEAAGALGARDGLRLGGQRRSAEGVMALVRAHKINSVELDLKDEAGEIGWNPRVPLARQMHSALAIYDLGKAVRQLHAQGVRVIGRLVCFRDPIHAAAAWKAGRRDEVVQTPDGGPYAGYGGFTNFANPAVRRYNIDIARGGRRARRRRDPLRLRAPPRRAAQLDGLPRPAGHARAGDRALPCREQGGARRDEGPRRRVGLRCCRYAADRGRTGHPGDGAQPRLRGADALPVALGPRRVRRQRPERQPVRDRQSLDGRLRPTGARHRRPRDAVAAGLLPRARLRRGGDPGTDPRCPRRGSRRVSPLGPGGHVHRRSARLERETAGPRPNDGASRGRARTRATARPEACAEARRETCRHVEAAAAGSGSERARPDPDRHAPHGPRRSRRRLRPDARGVPGRARAPMEARLRARRHRRHRQGAAGRAEGHDARRVHVRRLDDLPARRPTRTAQ